MKFFSTKGAALHVSASEALLNGMAPDGGLYVPQEFPRLDQKLINQKQSLDFATVATQVLLPYFSGDAKLEKHIPTICKQAFDFDIPINWTKDLNGAQGILELFHGPTAAFKDVGARFLAESLSHIFVADKRQSHVLVATSGDTGGAVAAAFYKKPNIEVVILFPQGKVTQLQKQQLTCWGENVRALEVTGNFDDCQRLVKSAFADSDRPQRFSFLSANSINIGRLLPQMAYHIYASICFYQETQHKPLLIIPSGNLGNVVAAFWAKRMGAPIGNIILSMSMNRSVLDYIQMERWKPRKSISTLANAMDVGNPSNIERLFTLFPDHRSFCENVSVFCVDDVQISETIARTYKKRGLIICPHTATAEFVRSNFFPQEPTLVVATAHPAKFKQVVEPLIGQEVEMPASLNSLLGKESKFEVMASDLGELYKKLERPLI